MVWRGVPPRGAPYVDIMADAEACAIVITLEWGAIAGFAAIVATVVIAMRVNRPVLIVREQQSVPQSLGWVVALENVGRSVARIVTFRVIADGRECPPRPLEDPVAYWQNVLAELGLPRSGMENDARLPALISVGANVTEQLFHATIRGPPLNARAATRKLRFEIVYVSVWGRFRLDYDFGVNT